MDIESLNKSGIVLRPTESRDGGFLRDLYASTRAEELEHVAWTDEQKARFIDMQFLAQKSYYEEIFPHGEFSVIERNALPVGRLYLNRLSDEIHVIDILIAPDHRGRGLGGALMHEILSDAELGGKIVTIYVESFNPARLWYDKLGFRQVGSNGVHHLMEWRAQAR